jgi:hypothetical protein
MAVRLAVAMLVASAMGPLRAPALRAQVPLQHVKVVPPLLALALNDLSFGTVLPGVPSTVNVHDPHRAGLFEVEGPPGGSVRVEFVLPAALESGGGALLPISFGPGDGFADFSRGRPPRGLVFDPHAPVIGNLGPNGRLYVRMGGTVVPGRPQAGGAYRATIAMTVYDLGS